MLAAEAVIIVTQLFLDAWSVHPAHTALLVEPAIICLMEAAQHVRQQCQGV